jgi:hypothetical protein
MRTRTNVAALKARYELELTMADMLFVLIAIRALQCVPDPAVHVERPADQLTMAAAELYDSAGPLQKLFGQI